MYHYLLRVRKKRKVQSRLRIFKISNKVSIREISEVINKRFRNQSGDSENANGMIRRYYPIGTDSKDVN